MTNNPFQKLEKLKIHIFRDRMRIGHPVRTFTAQINPERYVQSFETTFDCIEGVGASAKQMAFMYLNPERLELNLIFDETHTTDYGLLGTLRNTISSAIGKLTGKGVAGVVEALRKEAMGINSATHEPAYLTVMWGPLDFDCRMEKMTVTYTLFDRAGIPLRAELLVVLKRDIDSGRRVRSDKLNSPDLTHTRVVTASDNLPMLAKEIYGDPSQYLMVARANGLDNFRKLEVGSTLRFPPLTQ